MHGSWTKDCTWSLQSIRQKRPRAAAFAVAENCCQRKRSFCWLCAGRQKHVCQSTWTPKSVPRAQKRDAADTVAYVASNPGSCQISKSCWSTSQEEARKLRCKRMCYGWSPQTIFQCVIHVVKNILQFVSSHQERIWVANFPSVWNNMFPTLEHVEVTRDLQCCKTQEFWKKILFNALVLMRN